MKYIITENRIEDLASRLALDKLNDMDFRFKKYKQFDFFPKGTQNAEHGIEADYAVGEGYHVLIGNSLFRSVRDLLDLTDEQTEEAFRKALNQKGIRKIALLHTLDFSSHRHLFDTNEGFIKESKMKIIIKESSLVHVIATFLDGMDHLKGVCHVGAGIREDGDIRLDVHIKKEAFIVFGGGQTVGKIRQYYTDKVSSYFGLPVHVRFEVVNKC